MLSNTHFEISLRESAGLFSLSKTDTDLFLLLQTGIITYEQLHITKLHGETEAAGRLSLKRLEKKGLIQSRTINTYNQMKYYFLTSKGKNYAKQFFPLSVFNCYAITAERRIPSGYQQLIHRIRTNDFYFSYIGYAESYPLALETEYPLIPTANTNTSVPRCDARLTSSTAEYYIEQDNSTQSEAILQQKIQQYLNAGFFHPCSSSKTLVFCLAFPRKQQVNKKPSYSIYKILLRFSKLWQTLEKEQGLSLDLAQFLQILDSSALACSVSANDRLIFKQICSLHPDTDNLNDLLCLKNAYLADTSHLEEQAKELDNQFQKRLKSHFSRFYNGNVALLAHAYSGMSIFAIPNHRLPLYQPYIMHREYHLDDYLLNSLMYHGLVTENWVFNSPIAPIENETPSLSAPMGFYHPIYGYILFELYPADLASTQRLHHFINNCRYQKKTIVIILLEHKEGHGDLLALSKTAQSKNIYLLFSPDIANFARNRPLYFYHLSNPCAAVMFDCDEFDERFQIISRKEDTTC